MFRWLVVLTSVSLLLAAPAHAETVTLRARIEAHGQAITLGDIFDGAGALAGRAIAPAPPPGQMTTLSMPLLAAAASAAGLDFTPPPGMAQVQVIRPGGAAATIPAASGGRSNANAAVHRGETVALVFHAPGIALATRARALEDAEIGQSVRLVNLASNRTIDGVVTAPGAASASAQ